MQAVASVRGSDGIRFYFFNKYYTVRYIHITTFKILKLFANRIDIHTSQHLQ